MVENRPWLTLLQHLVLICGVVIVVFPIWIAFVASTHEGRALVLGGQLMPPPADIQPPDQADENHRPRCGPGLVAKAATGLRQWGGHACGVKVWIFKSGILLRRARPGAPHACRDRRGAIGSPFGLDRS